MEGSSYQVEEGSPLYVTLAITGAQPVNVTVQGKNQNNETVSGFSVDHGVGTYVHVGSQVPAGVYNVTVTATNASGSKSATFRVEVVAKPTAPVLVAPTFNIRTRSYSIYEGLGIFTLDYTLTGTEPITVSVKAMHAEGRPATGFSMGNSIYTILVATEVMAGDYELTLTASCDGGTATALVYLTVVVKS